MTSPSQPNPAVIDWLLDSDPAIRWQVMRDLLHAPADQVAAERARVATQGWGADLLAQQGADGTWAGAAFNRGWNSTMHTLSILRLLGLDPASAQAQHAIGLVRDQVNWTGWDMDGKWRGMDFKGNPFFAGETEPCINGQVGASGAYFHQDCDRILKVLLNEQLSDGGWNCEAENGSTHGSFNTTICVLEALLEYELAYGPRADVTEVRLRGQEYLLDRHLFHRRSTGAIIDSDRKDNRAGPGGHPAWTQLAFPNWWHYDILRGLDYLRQANATPDPRAAEAIAVIESKRDSQGRWPLNIQYPGTLPVQLNEGEGQASRWVTLRALRVLDWYSAKH